MGRLELLAAGAALVLCACGGGAVSPPAGPGGLAAGDHGFTLAFGDTTRRYLVHVPEARFEGREARPVVLSYHGGGGNPENQRDWTRLDDLADAEGFLAVYPAGTPAPLAPRLLTWNAGFCCGAAARQHADDVGFTLALLADLAQRTPVDATRIYATGMSNGGMMAQRLALDAGDRIAAVVSVAGVVKQEPFALPTPVPLLHIHSVDDPRADYAGGLGPPFPLTNQRVDHAPVERVLGEFAAASGCTPGLVAVGEARRWTAPDGAVHTAQRFSYAGCRDGVEVGLWRLTGAGHVWPGVGPKYRLLGPATQVIDANRVAWDFFRRFRRPEAPALAAAATPSS